MSSGGQTTTTNNSSQISQTQLPPWVNQAAEQNYGFAQNVAMQPLQQYQGQLVADVGPQMQQAWNLAANSGSAGQPQYQESEAGFLGTLGAAAPTASSYINNYMNPYTQNVINTTMPLMQQSAAQQQSALGGNAAQNNAFGGSRQGVAQGVLGAQNALNMGQMAAGLNQANYQQALQAAQGDVNAQLQQQNAANVAAQGLGTLGQQAQLNQVRQFTEEQTAGALEQQQAQNQINAQVGQFQQAFQYPYQQLGVLQSALGMTPYGLTNIGTSSSQQTQEQAPNYLNAAMSGLSTLSGLFGGGGPFGVGGAFALASDARMKTDITPVGVDPATGVPIHSFHYKGATHLPKTVGPLAQNVEKVMPQAVSTGPGGMKQLNLGALPPSLHPVGPVKMGSLAGPGRPPGSPSMRPPSLPTYAPVTAPPRAMPMPAGVPSPAGPGATGTPRGAPMGGGPRLGMGPLPGALAPPVPMGGVGALGANLRPARLRPRSPRVTMGPGMGAMGISGG